MAVHAGPGEAVGGGDPRDRPQRWGRRGRGRGRHAGGRSLLLRGRVAREGRTNELRAAAGDRYVATFTGDPERARAALAAAGVEVLSLTQEESSLEEAYFLIVSEAKKE